MLGAVAFLVTLLVLVLVHEYGHFKAARWFGVTVEEFGFGFPPAIVRRRLGRTTFSLNWLPLGGFVRIKGEEAAVDAPDSFSAQSAWRRAAIIAAGVLMNVLVAVLLFTVGFSVGLPQELSTPAPPAALVRDVTHTVVATAPGSPAAAALEAGDIIRSIDGQAFSSLQDLQRYIRGSEPTGQPLAVAVERAGSAHVVSLQPRQLEQGIYGLGVSLFSHGVVSYPLARAPLAAVQLTAELFALIVRTLAGVAAGFWQGTPVPVDVAGPVGIAVLTSQVVSLGWTSLLHFMAVLSINLAFINLLPFPALDGGRLVFIGLEVIRGRAVAREVEGRVHRWGFAVLLVLVAVVTYFDLKRFGGVFSTWWDSIRLR